MSSFEMSPSLSKSYLVNFERMVLHIEDKFELCLKRAIVDLEHSLHEFFLCYVVISLAVVVKGNNLEEPLAQDPW